MYFRGPVPPEIPAVCRYRMLLLDIFQFFAVRKLIHSFNLKQSFLIHDWNLKHLFAHYIDRSKQNRHYTEKWVQTTHTTANYNPLIITVSV